MSAIDDDAEVVKRTNDIYQPGLIKRTGNDFVLIEAEKTKRFNKDDIGSPVDGGYVMRGEKNIKGKICVSVFKAKEPETEVCIFSEQHKKMLEIVLNSYQNEKTNKNLSKGHKGYVKYEEEWKKFLKGKGEDYFPVYYSKVLEDSESNSSECITKDKDTTVIGKFRWIFLQKSVMVQKLGLKKKRSNHL